MTVMTERIRTSYCRLFEIRLLHHYWLDEGSTVFDLISTVKQKASRLQSYDRRPFLAITPTPDTEKAIKWLGGVYKETALGCVVAAPDHVMIPLDTVFEFIVTIEHPAFFNYSALTLRSRRIFELYHPDEDKIYRYKENVAVLSNYTGAARGADPNKALYLSREFPGLADDDRVESLVKSGNALMQLTSDQPDAGTQQLHAQASGLPVFMHQGDIPLVSPPPGLALAPFRGIFLSEHIPDNIFALIRLFMVRPKDKDFSIVDDNGHVKSPHPVFQLRFKNRSTIWKYIDSQTGAVRFTETNPLPLTHFGNAGTKRKPEPGLVKPIAIGTKITRIVSEIFI